MKVCLDLFSGTGSATKVFKESSEWEVVEVDLGEEHNPDIQANVMELEASNLPDADFIWASPPCKAFSVASIGHHWEKKYDEYIPQTDFAEKSIDLVKHTIDLIEEINPDYWFMENPRAMMRKILREELDMWPEGTVTYCQYGDNRMKPTDLWGNHPESFVYKSCSNGADCHDAAPRGSRTGTQGMSSDTVRGMIPYGLSKAVFDSVQNPDKKKGQQKLEA